MRDVAKRLRDKKKRIHKLIQEAIYKVDRFKQYEKTKS